MNITPGNAAPLSDFDQTLADTVSELEAAAAEVVMDPEVQAALADPIRDDAW